VYDDLRAAIDAGQYVPGEPLPNERDLVERYHYSRATIQRAYAQLELTGVVASNPPVGRTVREPLELWFDASRFELVYADDPELGLDQWGQDVAAQGWEPRQTVTIDWLRAGRRVARWLAVEPDTELLRRRRIRMVRRHADEHWVPVIIADSWFPRHIAMRTASDGVAPLLIERNLTLHGGIMRAIGVVQAQFKDEIRARMPTDDETTLLALLPGTPVLEMARVGFDAAGERVRVIVSTIDASSQYLQYVLEVPTQPVDTRQENR
jgi:GntR family transcriptional regulator